MFSPPASKIPRQQHSQAANPGFGGCAHPWGAGGGRASPKFTESGDGLGWRGLQNSSHSTPGRDRDISTVPGCSGAAVAPVRGQTGDKPAPPVVFGVRNPQLHPPVIPMTPTILTTPVILMTSPPQMLIKGGKTAFLFIFFFLRLENQTSFQPGHILSPPMSPWWSLSRFFQRDQGLVAPVCFDKSWGHPAAPPKHLQPPRPDKIQFLGWKGIKQRQL